MHACHKRLVDYPPEGYEIVVRESPQEKMFKATTSWTFLRTLLRFSDTTILPYNLVKAWLEKSNRPPEDTVLTYASEHLVLRPEPWVLDMEFAHLLVGRHPKHLKRFKNLFERALTSSYCRKIICWSEAARKTLTDLNMEHFEDKVTVLHWSVRPRSFVKELTTNDKVKLFFLGTDALTTSSTAFEYKGGRETLAAFAQLRPQYPNIELVMRGDPPPDVRRRYAGMEGLRIIDKFIPWDELEYEYRSSDIFIMPSHTTIFTTLLEAMSFELPVITIDSWSNAEFVEDGKTGLVAPKSQRLPYFYPGTAQTNFGTAQFDKAMLETDPLVVADLASRLSRLIDDPELRRRMGKAARWEVEEGRFSLATMNESLGKIFDEAIA